MTDIGAKITLDGEKQFKNELAQITQEGKTLSAQMDQLTTSFKNEGKSEQDAAELSKKLSQQIENQQKLVDKLKEAVARSTEKTGENSTQTLKWKEKLAKAEKGLSDLEKQSRDAASGVDKLGDEEQETTEQTSTFGDVLKANLASKAIIAGVEALAGVVKDVAKFFADAVKGAAEYADEVTTLTSVTGMSTDAIQEYKYAADLLDVDFSTIQGSLTKLTSKMASAKDGNKAATEAFEKLGVSVVDADGNLMDANDVFDEAIKALGEIDNETERDAASMDIFGKSAKELNPLIEAGTDSLNEFRKEAHDVGAVLDSDTLESLSDVQDSFDRIKGTWGALKKTLGAKIGIKILPDLKDIVGTLQNFAKTGNFDDLFDGLTKSAEKALKKLPKLGEKVLNAIPKLISKLADSQIWSSLTAAVGKTLSALFKNAPEIIKAGIKLAGSLLEGVMKGILDWTGVFDAIDDLIYGSSEAAKEAAANLKRVREELEAIPDANKRIEDRLGDVNAKSKEAEKWVEVFDKLSQKTDLTKYETELLNQAVNNLNDLYPELDLSVDESTGRWSKNTDEIRKNIEALQARYRADAYYRAASEALTDIAKLEAESEALRDQKEALEEQIKPVGELYDRYVQLWDISDAFYNGGITKDQAIQQLKDLGVEVENDKNLFFELDGIVDDAYDDWKMKDWELYDQQREFESVSEAVQVYDDKIAELSKDVEYFYKKAEEASQSAFELSEKTMHTEGQKLSEALLAGYMKGFKKYRHEAMEEGRNFIKGAVQIMKDEAKIKSPSKVTENLIGKNLALGVVKGWEDVLGGHRINSALSLPIGSMASTTNNTTNLGGVSIIVNSAQGQDTNAIADAVMRKMQSAVDARRAVFA